MSFKILFFDLDGTLIDSLEDIRAGVNKTLEESGRAPVEMDIVRKHVGQGSRTLIKNVTGIEDAAEVDRLLKRYVMYYENAPTVHTYVYDGVLETIKQINCIKVLFTNKIYGVTDRVITHFGLKPYFDEVVTPETYGVTKPDPLGIHMLLKKYGLGMDDALMIGDSKYDIATAKNAGIKVLAVTYGFAKSREEIEEADYIVDRFGEILSYL